MNYWEEAVAEAFDAEGVVATSEQRAAIAGWMKAAHECFGASYAPDPVVVPHNLRNTSAPVPAKQWWEDTSQLSGSDWVLAKRIQQLVASRYG